MNKEPRERLGDILHTLHHIGISAPAFEQLAREVRAGSEDSASGLRNEARRHLSMKGIAELDAYISDRPIPVEVIEPPLPSAILGALGALGTSEARLVELEPLIH